MLISEKERLERLIESIDAALKGVSTMDFAVFNKEESSKMFLAMLEHMPDAIKGTAMKEFGSVEKWKEHYLNAVFVYILLYSQINQAYYNNIDCTYLFLGKNISVYISFHL